MTEPSWGPRDWSEVKPHWAVRSTGHQASNPVTGPGRGACSTRLSSSSAAGGLSVPPSEAEREAPRGQDGPKCDSG